MDVVGARNGRRGRKTIEPEVCHLSAEVLVGRYRLATPLGAEDGTELWAGEHLILKRPVLIKFLTARTNGEAAAREALERFRFEAQVSAMLSTRSQHIVTVHDADVGPSGPFLVMERDRGASLADLLRYDGPLSVERAFRIVEQVAEALVVAHDTGIVHRDVRPENIWISSSSAIRDFVKLGNFVVAKSLDQTSALDNPRATRPGIVIGTPDYMSPEQVMGEVVDTAIDRWALAVVAYEALTGVRPFAGTTPAQTMLSVLTRCATPPSTLRPELTRAVDAWFTRAFNRDISQRFRSPREMMQSLREALALDGNARRWGPPLEGNGLVTSLPPLPPAQKRRWFVFRRAAQGSFVVVAALALAPVFSGAPHRWLGQRPAETFVARPNAALPRLRPAPPAIEQATPPSRDKTNGRGAAERKKKKVASPLPR